MLSLYIHVPFCVKKCPYCGFYSTQYESSLADVYVASLRSEAAAQHEIFGRQVFQSVYIGGGTPTALSDEQITAIGALIHGRLHLAEDAEITVEANPNTATPGKLALWRRQGVNRLSLGVQSFSRDVLSFLGRLHGAEQAEESFSLARKAGFGNIGMDLIYGVPQQTMTQWKGTLEAALRCRPEHLSLYSLSFDDGSQFKRDIDAGRMQPADDDAAADMYEQAVPMLAAAGYGRYELSNFSLPGYECRHNIRYWNREEYLGLGPGAWSFIKGRRSRTIADVREYGRRLRSAESLLMEDEVPGPEQSARETVMLNLRMMKGLDIGRFGERYGRRHEARLEGNYSRLAARGLLRREGSRVFLTERGILLSNEALTGLSG